MKNSNQYLLLAACAAAALTLANVATADVSNTASSSMPSCCGRIAPAPVAETSTNAVPDLLKTCPVSGEKLGGDMGKPYVFAYKGQEVKLCCKGCKKDFDKNPEKYLKLIRAADKK